MTELSNQTEKPTIKGKRIAVLKGGPGSEREVSLASAKSVCEALASKGVTVIDVDVRGEDFKIPEPVDIAFNVIHGTFGEDGRLQRILEEMGIPYTGAGVASSETAFDKILSKKRFIESSVPTPAFELFVVGQSESIAMELPFVIKPPREGSSVGVHIIRDQSEVAAAIEDAKKYDQIILIEPFVSGKELTVGVLGKRALPVVHIQPKSGFYDMTNKYPWMSEDQNAGSDYIVPAELSAETTRRVTEAAVQAHQSLGIEIYSRVDLLLDEDEQPWVLEVNTIPGMTSTSLLPKAAAAVGIDFAELCEQITVMSLLMRKGKV
ncbi:MAG: D-alanine-D-alanine ligase [Verrucomicrobiales bacterium]|jgi:D-alanine-D-alanine ligase